MSIDGIGRSTAQALRRAMDETRPEAERQAMQGAGLTDKASIIYYLHTMADNHLFNLNGNSFRDAHLNIFKAADGTIIVSEAARESYLAVRLADNGSQVSLDPAKSFVVRNGIDPFIHTIHSKHDELAARDSIGLAPGLGKVVSYVGRIDNIKGSDFLATVLEHYEKSHRPADNEVGFVIASSSILNAEAPPRLLKRILANKRLISEGRLRLVLDISKFTRGDERFVDDVQRIILAYARGHGFASMEAHPAYGGMVSVPVQTLSDIYLHPSRSEGLSLAVVEALFSGAYTIATPVGGIPDVVSEPDTGQLIELPAIIQNPNSGTQREYSLGMKEVASRIVEAITGFSGPLLTPLRLRELTEHFKIYTHLNMFDQFENAVSRIIRRDDA